MKTDLVIALIVFAVAFALSIVPCVLLAPVDGGDPDELKALFRPVRNQSQSTVSQLKPYFFTTIGTSAVTGIAVVVLLGIIIYKTQAEQTQTIKIIKDMDGAGSVLFSFVALFAVSIINIIIEGQGWEIPDDKGKNKLQYLYTWSVAALSLTIGILVGRKVLSAPCGENKGTRRGRPNQTPEQGVEMKDIRPRNS